MKDDKLELKIRKKRLIIKISLLIVIIAAVFCFAVKSSYFDIKNVIVKNNKFVSTKEVLALVDLTGKNIFTLNGKKIEETVCNNPYVESINIKKRFPSTVEICINEKEIRGLVKFKNGFINVDSQGKMVQIVNQFPGNNLPLIEGIKVEQYIPNKSLIDKDTIKENALKKCLEVINTKELKNKIYSVNIADSYNIVFKTKDGMEVRVGDSSDLDYKLSYACSIMDSASVKGKKGYIEIQPDGGAIFKENK